MKILGCVGAVALIVWGVLMLFKGAIRGRKLNGEPIQKEERAKMLGSSIVMIGAGVSLLEELLSK